MNCLFGLLLAFVLFCPTRTQQAQTDQSENANSNPFPTHHHHHNFDRVFTSVKAILRFLDASKLAHQQLGHTTRIVNGTLAPNIAIRLFSNGSRILCSHKTHNDKTCGDHRISLLKWASNEIEQSKQNSDTVKMIRDFEVHKALLTEHSKNVIQNFVEMEYESSRLDRTDQDLVANSLKLQKCSIEQRKSGKHDRNYLEIEKYFYQTNRDLEITIPQLETLDSPLNEAIRVLEQTNVDIMSRYDSVNIAHDDEPNLIKRIVKFYDKLLVKMSEFQSKNFATRIRELENKLSIVQTLEQLTKVSEQNSLASWLTDVIEHEYFVPKSAIDSARITILELVCFGLQIYVLGLYFTVHQYSLLSQNYLNSANLELYSANYKMAMETCTNDYAELFDGKQLVDQVIYDVLVRVQELDHLKASRPDIVQFVLESRSNLEQIQSEMMQLNAQCSEVIEDIQFDDGDSIETVFEEMDFTNFTLPLSKNAHFPWKGQNAVQYSIVFQGNQSVFSSYPTDWSDEVTVEKGNAFPMVTIPTDPSGQNRNRLVFRKFVNSNNNNRRKRETDETDESDEIETDDISVSIHFQKPPIHHHQHPHHQSHLVALITDPAQTKFRDVNRELYNELLQKQPNVENMKIYLEAEADANAPFVHHRRAIHFVAEMSPQQQSSIMSVLNLSCTGLDLTVQDDLGITPLYIASELNRLEFVRKLIHEYKIMDLNPKTNEEMLSLTPLHIATIKGNVEIVKMLLNGTNYSRVSSEELSALHYAAAFNQVAVLGELYKVYNQNQNQLQFSPLEFAAVNDCQQTVSTIIDKFNSTFDQIEKALHLAALFGSQNVATILLNSLSKTDYNSKTVNGSTVLHLAAFSGNEAILERANSGPAIDLPNDSEQSALYIAFQHNNVRAAKLLIQKGANVHIRVARNRTLLHVAAIYGDYLAAKHLIEHGIEHSATDQYGRVPLHYAVSYGYLSIVHLLVQSGANPNAIDGDGFPVLHMIANLEEVSAIKILNRLLSSKSTNVNILAENGSNFTVLHLACAKGFHSIVAKLIEKGANVNAQTELAETPLHFASTFGTVADLTIAKLLLQKSANLNAKDRYGLTPIYYAVAGHGRSELIEHFIESGADLGIKSPKGETLVWTAVNRRRFNVAKALIEARTDYVSPRTVDQLTPFLMACQTGDYDFVKYLSTQKGFVRSTADKSEALLLAISSKRDISVVKYLIDELQIDPTGIMDSEFGLTLFNLAVERNSTDIALYLAIEKSSAIDCLQADKSNYRPLHYAAKNGNLQLVKYLIEQKAQKENVNDATKEGYTPLYLAAMNGNLQVVEYLCAKGAKLKIVDQANRSLLNAATEYNQTEIVWFLLNDKIEKVDLSLEDSRGLAPLHHAARQNNHPLIEYFATQHSNFDLKDNRGANVLYNAIEHQGDLSMVQFLLHNQSATLEFEPENLENFVSLALQHNKHDIAEYLVRNTKVDCQTAGKSGNTPLVEAIRRHQTELVKLLIHEKGVNYGVQSDKSKRTALHEAIYYEHVEAIQILLLNKSLNSNLKAKDSNRETPLDYLVKNGVKDKSVKYFIFDFKDHKFNKTLLHIVAEMGRTSVAKLFLERGADVNAQDDLLNTPLHWAVHNGNIDTVRLLVEWIGANLTLTNHYDQTALELAEDEDKPEIVDYLKDKTQRKIRRKRKVIIDQIDGEQQPSWWINNLIESFCIVLLFVASLYA